MDAAKLSLSSVKGQDRNTANKQHAGSVEAKFQGGTGKCATGAKTAIRPPKEGTTIGTWNVRSLHACRKVQELTHELKRYRWDILGRGLVLEKPHQMRDTRSGFAKKTQNASMG